MGYFDEDMLAERIIKILPATPMRISLARNLAIRLAGTSPDTAILKVKEMSAGFDQLADEMQNDWEAGERG